MYLWFYSDAANVLEMIKCFVLIESLLCVLMKYKFRLTFNDIARCSIIHELTCSAEQLQSYCTDIARYS